MESSLLSRVLPACLAALALCPAFAHAAGPACRPDLDKARLTQTLIGLEQRRQAAYVSGDQAELERQFAAEYVHTNLRGQTTNRAQELAFYRPGTFSLAEGHISEADVRDYGDTAVLLARVDWMGAHYRPSPKVDIDLSMSFRITRVYVWRDSRWQVAASHASGITAPAPPPAIRR